MHLMSVPEIAKAARPWCKVVSMRPPFGDDKVYVTAEMLVSAESEIPGFRVNYAYYKPSQYDLEALFKGGFIEFAQYGNVVQPFSAAVWPLDHKEQQHE